MGKDVKKTGAVFLRAAWRWLLMVNYEVEAGILLPLVPRGVRLDLFGGRALVSVVGFRFVGTKVLGVAVPMHRNFDEINLRFYVKREMEDGTVRRGVAFVRELVPRAAIAVIAKLAYNEPYRAVGMRSVVPKGKEAPGVVEYGWKWKGAWEYVRATASGEAAALVSGSEEEFITEHYWGYTRQRDGGTVEYEVRHPSWKIWRCEGAEISAGAAAFYGEPFVEALKGRPVSAFLADGSDVSVGRPGVL